MSERGKHAFQALPENYRRPVQTANNRRSSRGPLPLMSAGAGFPAVMIVADSPLPQGSHDKNGLDEEIVGYKVSHTSFRKLA